MKLAAPSHSPIAAHAAIFSPVMSFDRPALMRVVSTRKCLRKGAFLLKQERTLYVFGPGTISGPDIISPKGKSVDPQKAGDTMVLHTSVNSKEGQCTCVSYCWGGGSGVYLDVRHDGNALPF